MNLHDLKIYLVNIAAILSIYTTINDLLKILIGAATFVYTVVKIRNEIKKSNK